MTAPRTKWDTVKVTIPFSLMRNELIGGRANPRKLSLTFRKCLSIIQLIVPPLENGALFALSQRGFSRRGICPTPPDIEETASGRPSPNQVATNQHAKRVFFSRVLGPS